MLRNQKSYRMSGNEYTENRVELEVPIDQEPGIVEMVGNQEPEIELGTSEQIVSVEGTQSVQSRENPGEQKLEMETIHTLLAKLTENVNNLTQKFDNTQAQLTELRDDLKESIASSENRSRENMVSLQNRLTENINNTQVRLTENLKSLQDHVGDLQGNIVSMEGRIENKITNITADIRNEIGRMENNIVDVRNSVTEVRSQVENLQTEIDGQIENKMEGLQIEVNRRVESTVGALHSQIDSMNTQVGSLNEQMANLQTVTQSMENKTRGRFIDLEREVVKINEMSCDKLRSLEKEINDVQNKLRENGNRSGNGEGLPRVPENPNERPGSSRACDDRPISEGIVRQNESENLPLSTFSVRAPNSILNDLVIPTFSNRADQNPVKFLNSLETYLELKMIPEAHKMLIVKSALTGPALAWRELVLGPDISYIDFRRKFMSNYWNNTKQDELRNKISHGKFNVKGRLNMEDYFLELGQAALLLDPPLSNTEFIDNAARHFPPEIRNALVVARPQTFEETIALLKQLQGRNIGDRSHDNRGDKEKSSRNFTKAEVNAFQSGARAGGAGFENRDPRHQTNEYQAQNSRSSPGRSDRRSSNYGPQRNFQNRGHRNSWPYRPPRENVGINCLRFNNKSRFNGRPFFQNYGRFPGNQNSNSRFYSRHIDRREVQNRREPVGENDRYPLGRNQQRVNEVIEQQNARAASPENRTGPDENVNRQENSNEM